MIARIVRAAIDGLHNVLTVAGALHFALGFSLVAGHDISLLCTLACVHNRRHCLRHSLTTKEDGHNQAHKERNALAQAAIHGLIIGKSEEQRILGA